jgi:hypothetical protein
MIFLANLADYKHQIHILDEIPLTSLGKVSRKKLYEYFNSLIPNHDQNLFVFKSYHQYCFFFSKAETMKNITSDYTPLIIPLLII